VTTLAAKWLSLLRSKFLEPALVNDMIGLAITEADNSICIRYQAQYGERLTFVRPLASWLETVEWQGQRKQRFTPQDTPQG
jgi:hypothetical protein